MEVSRAAVHAWFLPAMLILVSVWSIQKTQDFVVFCPLMSPSTTSSRSSAFVLSQFFSPDLIRTFSTSIGIGAPERTCSILSRSVSLDLFGRLNIFFALGLWPGPLPTSHDYSQSRIEHMHPVTSKILEQLHEPQSSTYGFRWISAKLPGYSQNTSKQSTRLIFVD